MTRKKQGYKKGAGFNLRLAVFLSLVSVLEHIEDIGKVVIEAECVAFRLFGACSLNCVAVLAKACCDDCDDNLVVKVGINGNTEDDVGILVCRVGDCCCRSVNIVKSDVGRSGDIDDNTLCALDCCFKQRTGDSSAGCLNCLVLAAALPTPM